MEVNKIIIIFTAISFIIYGLSSFKSKRMASEYKRWGFNKSRKIIGLFQLLGGLGLLLSFGYRPLLLVSSSGLLVMMFFAIMVRIKIKDPIIEILPAITYLLLTALIINNSI
jgi:hypothetical protein